MAPTTRSASKRSVDPSVPPGSLKVRRHSTRKRLKKERYQAVNIELPRCPLLEMPPEIRNRIYNFCKEEIDSGWCLHHPLRKTKKPTDVPRYSESRKFFPLTQTCNQIRSEYRPLWLRQSSVLIDVENIDSFVSTFYVVPGARQAWYRNAPQTLFITWDHDKVEYVDGQALLDIKPLLKLRASTPLTNIKFVCRRTAEFDLQCVVCSICGHCIHCNHGDSDFDSDGDSMCDYLCSHDETLDEIFSELADEYAYLDALNHFLDNSTEAWLAAIREDLQFPMLVECTMGPDLQRPTIYIRFGRWSAPPLLRKKDMYKSAAAYLTQMGIMDLEQRSELDFVVGISTGKYARPATNDPLDGSVATYNQIQICGHTYKSPLVATQEMSSVSSD